MKDVDMANSSKKIEAINNKHAYRERSGGRRGKTFEQSHTRVTLYLQNDLYAEIQGLRELGKITNLTRFVNEAIREYLGGQED